MDKLAKDLQETAHSVRVFGNDGAHPDKDGLTHVTEQDAGDALEFVARLHTYVYDLPGRTEAVKARRSP